jgi:hypothetical protein
MQTSHPEQISDDSADPRDQALVHQYIRIFGRTPTDAELERYARAKARVATREPIKLRMARLISRV